MTASPFGTPLDVTPDIDRKPWTDLPRDTPHGNLARIGLLRHGTTGGRATAHLVVHLDDGTHVIAETTWRLLRVAVQAMAAGPVGSEETE